MKQLLYSITFLLLTAPVLAGGSIEKNIRQLPEMDAYCTNKIAYYQSKVDKYNAIKPENRRRWHKTKLKYYEIQLEDWITYCTETEEEDE